MCVQNCLFVVKFRRRGESLHGAKTRYILFNATKTVFNTYHY